MMTPTRAMLCLARAVGTQGYPANDEVLHTILLHRCGAEQADWDRLVQDQVVAKKTIQHPGRTEYRWELTKDGRKWYNKEKKGRYF